jgi:Na+-transporting NADH:ubiquinone oxidoreductase subunit NqrB
LTQNSGDETPPTDKDKPGQSDKSAADAAKSYKDQTAAAAGEQMDTQTRAARQSVVGGVVSSVKYLQDAHAEAGTIKLRSSDRATWVLLILAVALIIAAQFLQNQKNLCTLIADALMAVVLFAFLGMRFGVLRSLSARQAVLTWQLIVGSFLLGMYFAFNTKLLALMQEGTLFK